MLKKGLNVVIGLLLMVGTIYCVFALMAFFVIVICVGVPLALACDILDISSEKHIPYVF